MRFSSYSRSNITASAALQLDIGDYIGDTLRIVDDLDRFQYFEVADQCEKSLDVCVRTEIKELVSSN